MRSLGLEAN